MYSRTKTSTLEFWYYSISHVASRCSSTYSYVHLEAVIAENRPEELDGTYTSVRNRVSNFASETSITLCLLFYF
jgi:hypothetical protein